jgi:hypothetical protein
VKAKKVKQNVANALWQALTECSGARWSSESDVHTCAEPELGQKERFSTFWWIGLFVLNFEILRAKARAFLLLRASQSIGEIELPFRQIERLQ